MIMENFRKGTLMEQAPEKAKPAPGGLDRINVEDMIKFIGSFKEGSPWVQNAEAAITKFLNNKAEQIIKTQGEQVPQDLKDAKFAFTNGINKSGFDAKLLLYFAAHNVIGPNYKVQYGRNQHPSKTPNEKYIKYKETISGLVKKDSQNAFQKALERAERKNSSLRALKKVQSRAVPSSQLKKFREALHVEIAAALQSVMIGSLNAKATELAKQPTKDRQSVERPDLMQNPASKLDNILAKLDGDNNINTGEDAAREIIMNAGNGRAQDFETLLQALQQDSQFTAEDIEFLIQAAKKATPGTSVLPDESKFIKSKPATPAAAPAATPGTPAAAAAAPGTPAAAATPGTPAAAAAPAAVTATTATAAAGSGRVDTRRARIARQAMGERSTSNAVTKLQALLVNAGYSVSELGGTTSFAPAPAQVQEVVNNLSGFKNFNNIWDRWLISEQVKPEDYAKFGIDGKYGDKTIDAVKRFQKDIVQKFGSKANLGKTGPSKNGVDGTMGKMTWAYLQKVAKGEIELPKPTPERKPEDLKKTQAQTKAVSDTRKAAYKATTGFLNAGHKIVNNSADNRQNNAYIQLRKYTKATRTSKGASGNSLWNDPRFWKFWIEGNEDEIKKIIRAGGGKKYPAAISASMPQDAARAKLTPLVKKHSKAIEAYTKALEAREDPAARKFPKSAKRDKAKEAGFLDKMFDGMRTGPEKNTGPAIAKLSAIFKQSFDKGRLTAMANGSVIRDNKAIIYAVGTGKQITDDVLDLYQAMKGAGTDDEKVKSIMEKYSNFDGVDLKNSPAAVFNVMFARGGRFYFKAHALFVMYQGYLTAINKKAKSEEEDLSENLLDWLRDDGFDGIYLEDFKRRLSFEKEVAKRILMIINPNNFNKLEKRFGQDTGSFNERIDIRTIIARSSDAARGIGAK